MTFDSIPPLDSPLNAEAVDGEVVLTSAGGRGRPVVVAMTPDAVLASLAPMQAAATAALAQLEAARLAAIA
jgi:hypothetical protein